MNKKYILIDKREIQNTIETGKKKVNNYFVIYYKENNLEKNRYCISVSKKIGNAVMRNKIKRQIKDIISKNYIYNENDYVIIVRKPFITLDFITKKEEVLKLFK